MNRKTKLKSGGLAEEIGKKSPFKSLEQEALLNLARTFSLLSADLTKLLKDHGVTGPQYNVLRILRGHGEPVSIYQILDEMITPQSDIPRLIDRMKTAELVEKTRCENDRRVIWVTLTKKGRAVLKKIDTPLMRLHKTQLGHMSKSQLAELNTLLEIARRPT